MPIKPYPIFLASSYELKPEREKFEIFIGRQNKRLIKKNVHFRLEIWEDMGSALNASCKQDDYNEVLNDAEIVVVIFWTKMGKFTREEFELAFQRFKETGKPLVYVYEKTAKSVKEPEQSKKDFINQLLLIPGKEQFRSTFEHYGDFESQFLQRLLDLFDNNVLTFGKLAKRHSLKAPFPPSLVIGREKELEFISEKFKNKGKVILVSSEGGVGKTTLASKYWHENRYTYAHCAYLFCERGIMKTMMDDGLGLQLHGLDDAEKIRLLQQKLSSIADDFLLFLDNANKAEDIDEFLKIFPGYNWNVLITSRSRGVLVNKADEISLSHLDPEDAKELFLKYYQEENSDFHLLLPKLLKAIDYHTLLIEVFSKNLVRASARGIDLKSFLEKFESEGIVMGRKTNTRLETDYAFHINQHVATPNDILEVLYDFSNLNEEEKYYLNNLALLPTDNYSQQFLMEILEPGDEVLFYETLDNLYQKGWLGGEYDALRLSPVIQNLILNKVQEGYLLGNGFHLILKIISLVGYEPDKDNAHTKFKWLPFGRHLVYVFNWDYLTTLLNQLGILLLQLGGKTNLVEAKDYLEKVLTVHSETEEVEQEEVASALCNLGMILAELGGKINLEKALQYIETSLVSRIALFGEDSPIVTDTRSNLSTVLFYLGGNKNLNEAKKQLKIILGYGIQKFGENSLKVASTQSNLANVLSNLGGEKNLANAKKLHEMALPIKIYYLGDESPSVAKNRSNLASVLKELGGHVNLMEAKILLEKSLASNTQNFGKESPPVAEDHTNLAVVLRELGGEGNLLEAREYVDNALASDIRNFGEDSPSVASVRSDLALVLRDLGGEENLLEAREHLENTLSSDIRNFGENSPRVAARRSDLALVLQDLGGEGNLSKAREHLENALASDIRDFAEDSPSVAKKRSNLALVLSDLGGEGNLLKAREHLENALSSDIRNFGENSLNTATTMFNLGAVLDDFGDNESLREAKKLLEKAKKIFLNHFGDEYHMVKNSQRGITWVEQKLQKLKDE